MKIDAARDHVLLLCASDCADLDNKSGFKVVFLHPLIYCRYSVIRDSRRAFVCVWWSFGRLLVVCFQIVNNCNQIEGGCCWLWSLCYFVFGGRCRFMACYMA